MFKLLIPLGIALNAAQATEIQRVDPYGNPQYHKDGLVIKGDKVYQTDPYGNIQYHKPAYKIKGDSNATRGSEKPSSASSNRSK